MKQPRPRELKRQNWESPPHSACPDPPASTCAGSSLPEAHLLVSRDPALTENIVVGDLGRKWRRLGKPDLWILG